jgi:hypothetical protein
VVCDGAHSLVGCHDLGAPDVLALAHSDEHGLADVVDFSVLRVGGPDFE